MAACCCYNWCKGGGGGGGSCSRAHNNRRVPFPSGCVETMLRAGLWLSKFRGEAEGTILTQQLM